MVTVIVPNFNHSKFLKQRIDSVLSQTYQDFEVILLDDCSVDSSRQIIEEYRGNKKISKIIFNDANSGSVFKQWKKGIEFAKGEYVWIAESDDWAESNFLSELVPQLDNNLNCAIAYCDSKIVDGEGVEEMKTFGELRNGWLSTNKWSKSYCNDGGQELKDSLLESCTIQNASAVLFRRKYLLEVNPFDIEFRFIGDWYAYIKLCLRYDVCYINLPLNNYRDHANNASKKGVIKNGFVREYFLLFNWILKNVSIVDKSVLINLFKKYTRHPLISLSIINNLYSYKELYSLNKGMFLDMLWYNIITPIKERT